MNLQNIEKAIVDAIEAIPSQFPAGARDALWTQAVKRQLGNLGEQVGCSVCTSGFRGCFDGEWLFDLCWYINSSEGRLLRLLLAAESEWSRDLKAVRYDFEKLLVAKAQLKLMVFQATGAAIEQTFRMLSVGIETYEGGSTGEIYLLACYDEGADRFIIKKVRGDDATSVVLPDSSEAIAPKIAGQLAESSGCNEIGRS